MARLQIIGPAFSSYVWAVRMVCAEKDVAYELVPAGLQSPEVLAIHPFGKVPVMRHGDVTLFESKAIATYIDKTFPGPKVRRRTRPLRSSSGCLRSTRRSIPA